MARKLAPVLVKILRDRGLDPDALVAKLDRSGVSEASTDRVASIAIYALTLAPRDRIIVLCDLLESMFRSGEARRICTETDDDHVLRAMIRLTLSMERSGSELNQETAIDAACGSGLRRQGVTGTTAPEDDVRTLRQETIDLCDAAKVDATLTADVLDKMGVSEKGEFNSTIVLVTAALMPAPDRAVVLLNLLASEIGSGALRSMMRDNPAVQRAVSTLVHNIASDDAALSAESALQEWCERHGGKA